MLLQQQQAFLSSSGHIIQTVSEGYLSLLKINHFERLLPSLQQQVNQKQIQVAQQEKEKEQAIISLQQLQQTLADQKTQLEVLENLIRIEQRQKTELQDKDAFLQHRIAQITAQITSLLESHGAKESYEETGEET